jgi:hypothetical protein
MPGRSHDKSIPFAVMPGKDVGKVFSFGGNCGGARLYNFIKSPLIFRKYLDFIGPCW